MPTSSELAPSQALARELGSVAAVAAAGPGDAVDGVAAGMVVRAQSAADVMVAMRVTAGHRATVVARGRATKLDWGSPPSSADVVVDVSGLDRIVDHAAGDLVVRVEPGVPLAALRAALAPAGQRLAVDEVVPGSTVGGVISTGLAGPGRLVHGSVRDLLLGVTVALADGRSATSGGRVVKNVAGYDLGKLYTGSFATLGIITEAILRLHHLPERRAWINVTAAAGDGLALRTTAGRVLASSAVPGGFELHQQGAGPIEMAILVEGTDRGVGERAATVAAALGGDATIVAEAPRWWGVLPGTEAGETLLKLTMPPAEVGAVVAAMSSDEVVLVGSAGAGVLWAGLDAGIEPAEAHALVARARRACASAGGSAVVLRAPAAVRTGIDAWGPIPAIDLMRRVKDGFDPEHRLAPGRFVGGI